jgi:small subunit ribosomal protein S17
VIEEQEDVREADAQSVTDSENSSPAPAEDATAETSSPTPDEGGSDDATPAADAGADEPAAEAEEAPAAEEPAEPEEQLSPKERRKRARGAAGEAKPQRTLEERLAEREADRQRLAAHRRTRRQRERSAREGGRQGTPPAEREAGRKRVRQGIVVSDKADKTITVKIEIARPHRVYKKIVRTSATLHAHDERNEAHIGDTVRIIESRPLSRTKRWRLVEILERAR